MAKESEVSKFTENGLNVTVTRSTKELDRLKKNEQQLAAGYESQEALRKGLFPIIGKVHVAYLIIMFLLKCFYAFVVTYRLAFEAADMNIKEKLSWVIVDEIMDGLFLIDIFITFNKPYYDENNLIVTDRGKIAIHYVKTWFFIDLIMLFPTSLFKYRSRNGVNAMKTIIVDGVTVSVVDE